MHRYTYQDGRQDPDSDGCRFFSGVLVPAVVAELMGHSRPGTTRQQGPYTMHPHANGAWSAADPATARRMIAVSRTSRVRQRDQAGALVAGHGRIVAESADRGRVLRHRLQPDAALGAPARAAALVAALADPDRGWDAIVIGEYERAFYGAQYASMAPLFEHYGIQLWTPEVGGQIDYDAEDHEQTMLALGLQSKREIARTRIRVRPGRHHTARPGWPRCAAVPAGRAAGPRPVRAAAGIGLVQRQAGLPVPPRLHQRRPPGLRPAKEHLYP